MTRRPTPRAVLDSDIIFSRVLHELMGRVASDLRLLDLVWSEQLIAEARRSLIDRKHLTEDVARRWVDYLPRSFPDGHTNIEAAMGNDALGSLSRDPDDRHVCALAITARAEYLFTHDRGCLSDRLRHHHIKVVRPEQFLMSALVEHSGAMSHVLELQAATWAGGRPVDELLAAIARAGAPEFTAEARASFNM